MRQRGESAGNWDLSLRLGFRHFQGFTSSHLMSYSSPLEVRWYHLNFSTI